MLDNTQKKILIDDSLMVRDIVDVLGEKLGLDNIEEFSLQAENDTSGVYVLVFAFSLSFSFFSCLFCCEYCCAHACGHLVFAA